jgi:hypothetical protein
VFQPTPIVVILFWTLCVVAGMAIGAFSGWLFSLITRCGPRGLVWDIVLGSLGFLAGFIGCILVPWPTNTIVEHLAGNTTVVTTNRGYQHPERVAILAAVVLPILHELYRFKRARATRIAEKSEFVA